MIASKKTQMDRVGSAEFAPRFARTPWVVGLVAILPYAVLIPSAQASVCSEAIAQLHNSARQLTHNNPADRPSAPQSIAAQLGHQPTPFTVHNAERTAESNFVAILARAEALDAEGKHMKCMEAVNDARRMLE